MAEDEVTAPENESEATDQEVDSTALEAAVDQAVEADQGGVGGAKEGGERRLRDLYVDQLHNANVENVKGGERHCPYEYGLARERGAHLGRPALGCEASPCSSWAARHRRVLAAESLAASHSEGGIGERWATASRN